jgi:hypothetical protein
MPPSHFFLKNKKKILKNKKKPKNIYKYMLGWPNHPIGGGRPPRLDFFKKKKKKNCDKGILGIKRSNGLNCHNLKVWGG